MDSSKETLRQLRAKNEDLRRRLEEAEETLDAIRSGEVDALVVSGPKGEQVFTLKSADYTYRALVENMGEGAATLDADGTILYCNKRLADMLQMPLEQMITSPFRRFVSPLDHRTFDALLQKAGREGDNSELNLITAKGVLILVNLSMNVLKLEEKPVISMIATDLTQQKVMEEMVTAGRLATSIIDQANEAILVCDEKGQIIRASAVAEQLCGADPLFKQFEDVFRISVIDSDGTGTSHGIDAEKPLLFTDLLKGGRISRRECTLTCPHLDKELILLISIAPLLNGKSRVIGCVIILTDITERKIAEKKVQHLNLVLLAVRNVNQLIARRTDLAGLIKGTCDNFVKTRGYYNAWIALLDGPAKLVTAAEAGLGKAFQPLLERLERGELPACGQKVLKKSGAVVIEDPSSACTDCPLAKKHYGGRRMSIRLEHGEKVYGVLTVSTPGDITLDKEEQSLFAEVAGDIAFALHTMEQEVGRSKAEEALRNSEERFRKILESAPFGYYRIGKDGLWQYVNAKWEKMHGFSYADVVGKSFEITQTEDAVEQARANVRRSLAGESMTGEFSRRRKDGKIEYHTFNIQPVYHDNQIVAIEGFINDITERKVAEDEKGELEQKAQLASRLASIGEMASGIAHEINNPLTSVIGYAQLLSKKELPEDIREGLGIINDGAQRVAGIVKRLLIFARQYKPERTIVNINSIIETTLSLRAYHLKTSNIKLTTRLAPDLPITIADAGQLQQVFLNLIVNAEVEMKQAHGKGNLSIRTEQMDNIIRISFKDDGPGIMKKNMERIFNPFFTTRKVGEGTGLGLSVCHGIIAEHGGRIYAESKLGKGATFVIELPIVTETETATAKAD